jgi:flagellar biosynthesis protein FlhB
MPGSTDDKTEAPTPRRRQQTREKGQVARSQDLSAAVPLLVGLLAISLLGPRLWQSLLEIVRTGLAAQPLQQMDGVVPFTGAILQELARRLLPFLLILFGAVLVTLLAQVGLLFTGQPLMPNLSKISPIQGFKRLFSIRSVMSGVTNFGKLLLVTVVVAVTFAEQAAAIIYASSLGIHDVFLLAARLSFEVGIRIAVVLIILALLDFAWQRYKHERDMRMTKEEVKDEFRSMEGDPKLKARRRQAQLQLAMQRLRKDVPTADVVVTNPTHVAVAIRYESDTMPAPKVVAKGADQLAQRIRKIAVEFGVPVVERPPLARALHESVEVGQYIPERFYRAIAEILAYVYELTGRSSGMRRAGLARAG